MKKLALNILRVLVSIGLLYYLISIIDFNKFIQTLSSTHLSSVGMALAALFLSIFFLAWRWLVLLKAHKIFPKLRQLNVYYYIGFFFNNFLPTSIGGDLSRAIYLAKFSGNRAVSLGSVFLERLIGIIATLLIAGFAIFWHNNMLEAVRVVYATIVLTILLLVFFALIMSRRLYKRVERLLGMITFYNIGERIIRVLDTLHYYRDKKGVLFSAFVLSLCSQFSLILMNYILARALGFEQISFGYFFLLVPVTFVISLLPSINGLGVRDFGYVFLLREQGMLPSQALSLSILVTIMPIAVSIVGGIFFLLYRHKKLITVVSEENLS